MSNIDETKVEELILLLLDQNPLIGSYNVQDKIYTKGMNIERYMEEVLTIIRRDELFFH